MKKSFGSKDKGHFRVAVFGSARIKKNDPNYKQVAKLSEMMAKEGIDVVTGGGPGLMQAANEGHKKGDKKMKYHSVGLGIKLAKEQKFNEAVGYKKAFNRFSNRLDEFMKLSNAVVVAPGGVGTMLEFFYTWQLVQVNHICHIPIILLGDEWPGLLKWLKSVPMKRKYFDKKEMESVFNVKTCEKAMEIIRDSKAAFDKGGKNFCINYKKYRL